MSSISGSQELVVQKCVFLLLVQCGLDTQFFKRKGLASCNFYTLFSVRGPLLFHNCFASEPDSKSKAGGEKPRQKAPQCTRMKRQVEIFAKVEEGKKSQADLAPISLRILQLS